MRFKRLSLFAALFVWIAAPVATLQAATLGVDFGDRGMWRYEPFAGWEQLTPWDPELIVDVSHHAVVDFGEGRGLWDFDGTSWTQTTPWDPYAIASWGDALAAGFDAGRGLWVRENGLWSQLTPWEPEHLHVHPEGLVAAFGNNRGIWLYDGSWTQLASWDPLVMDLRADNLVASFDAGRGTWLREAGVWTRLTNWQAGQLVATAANIVADFGPGRGVWRFGLVSRQWVQLASWTATDIEPWGTTLAAAFIGHGLWLESDGAWSQLTPWEPTDLTASGNRLYTDFGMGRGVHLYDGSWTRLTNWTTESSAPLNLEPVQLQEDLTSVDIYPYDNWWRVDVSSAPLDPASQAFVQWIGGASLHPDFGPPPYGIPYVTVSSDQPLVPVTFTAYPDESDVGAPGEPPGYPIPDAARTSSNYIEGGVAGGGGSGDRHLLILDRDRQLLYETWATTYNDVLGRWEAGSGAAFDLKSNARRPAGWTSADAAGLAVLPGLIRYDEVFGPGEIEHAFRFTLRATNGHVWPAIHTAGSTTGALPMGARMRLKASVDISGYSAAVQKIFRAMKRYGLIVADNGSDMYITGTMDARWDNDDLNPAFASLTADDFEVVELGWAP